MKHGGAIRQQAGPLALLLIVPLVPVLADVVGAAPVWVFAAGAGAIGILAD